MKIKLFFSLIFIMLFASFVNYTTGQNHSVFGLNKTTVEAVLKNVEIKKNILSNADKSVLAPMSGTYSIGAGAGDDYINLQTAATNLYISGASGPVIFELSSFYDPTLESFPVSILGFSGASSVNTLTVKPADGVNVAYNTSSGDSITAIIMLVDASYVTIDGSNNGTTSQNISIKNTSVSNFTAPVAFLTVTTPGTNVTVKNCILQASSKDYETVGVFSNRYNNVLIENNLINSCNYGVMVDTGVNVNVINNIIGSDSASEYVNYGIGFNDVTDITVQGNTVKNIYSNRYSLYYPTYAVAVNMGGGNVLIEKNLIKDIVQIDTTGVVQAIALRELNSNNVKIYNNSITGLASNSYTGNYPTGIAILCPAITNGIDIKYNTIYLPENTTYGAGTGSDGAFVSGISIQQGTGIVFKNNIIFNNLGERDGDIYTTWGVAILTSLASSPFSDIDNNVYYVSGNYNISVLAFNTSGPQSLDNWRLWTADEAHSSFQDPLFVSGSDLSLLKCSPAIAHAEPDPLLDTDVLGNARDSVYPSSGAYEYDVIQASNVSLTIPAKGTGNLHWDTGSGCKTAVFMKQGNVLPEKAMPVNGTTYIAIPTYTYGSQIGTTGWYCVYNGDYPGADIQVTGQEGEYTVMACEYFGGAGNEVYITNTEVGNPAVGNVSARVEHFYDNDVSIYPNPSIGVFNINLPVELKNKNIEIQINDISGKLIYKNILSYDKNISVDLSDKPFGIYFINIKTDTGSYYNKIIKK